MAYPCSCTVKLYQIVPQNSSFEENRVRTGWFEDDHDTMVRKMLIKFAKIR